MPAKKPTWSKRSRAKYRTARVRAALATTSPPPIAAAETPPTIDKFSLERVAVMAKILEILIGDERTTIACELAVRRGCTAVDIIRRAFDEYAISLGRGTDIARIHRAGKSNA